ncbi:MAG: CHAP domain-containing protein [Bacteroidota bacterium]
MDAIKRYVNTKEKKVLALWTGGLLLWTLLLLLFTFFREPQIITITKVETVPQVAEATLVSGPLIGDAIDYLNEVPIYFNGGVRNTSGRNESTDGYNYGLKWQCVEFVKRYYYDYLNHRMPNTWGHAREFFNLMLTDGDLNPDRGLYQFRNGSQYQPRVDDILVFGIGKYGHVAIISKVTNNYIEFAQQNVGETTRDQLELTHDNGRWRIRDARVLGWLSKYK